jgi:predicted lipoprotein with Yx(FWY)xxD motif
MHSDDDNEESFRPRNLDTVEYVIDRLNKLYDVYNAYGMNLDDFVYKLNYFLGENHYPTDAEGNLDLYAMNNDQIVELNKFISYEGLRPTLVAFEEKGIDKALRALKLEYPKYNKVVRRIVEGEYAVNEKNSSIYSLDPNLLGTELKKQKTDVNARESDEEDEDSDTVSSDDEGYFLEPAPKTQRSLIPSSIPLEEPPFKEPTISVRSHPVYGDILVGEGGRALYAFLKDDNKLNKSNCDTDCLKKWPPVVTLGKPIIASNKINPRKISSTFVADGHDTVTYFGWPLYYWYQDVTPEDTKGQAVDEVWYLISDVGRPVKRRRTPLPQKIPPSKILKTSEAPSILPPSVMPPSKTAPLIMAPAPPPSTEKRELEPSPMKKRGRPPKQKSEAVEEPKPEKKKLLPTHSYGKSETVVRATRWLAGELTEEPNDDMIEVFLAVSPIKKQDLIPQLKSPRMRGILKRTLDMRLTDISNAFNKALEELGGQDAKVGRLIEITEWVFGAPTSTNFTSYKSQVYNLLKN